jgi:signal transduction histidine kinase/CheY-like chemotaxis protein
LIVQAFLATSTAPLLALAAIWHERRQSAAEMESRIEQRTFQLAEADRRKDHFLAVLAHELRNPLAPISHALALWPSICGDQQRLEEIRSIMTNQVRHMTGLIDDLLDISRIAGRKIVLRTECVDMRDVVQLAVQSVESSAAQAGHKIRTHVPSRAVNVSGDRARLVQIVGNLLNNAVKYSIENGKIDIALESVGACARVTVRDNGLGIPQAELGRIFDLFAQVDQSLERSHGGLGIGLTLVKSLVELHGGHVHAYSEGPGHGSRFEVTIPIMETPQNSLVTGSTSQTPRQLPMRRILVVDDTGASGRMLGLLLKSLGQQVEVCFDGPSALETVATFRPSLIFLDIAMPGMSGYEVATKLKSSPETQHITLVAMTGFGQASDRQRAFEAGFDHHMVKPANLEALTQVIEQAPH